MTPRAVTWLALGASSQAGARARSAGFCSEVCTGRVPGSTAGAADVSSARHTEARTMRKAEIVQRIAQELGCTTTKAETAVEAILTTIKASLQQGGPPLQRGTS